MKSTQLRFLQWTACLFFLMGIQFAEARPFQLEPPFQVTFPKLEFSAGEAVRVNVRAPVYVHNGLRNSTDRLEGGVVNLGTMPSRGGAFQFVFTDEQSLHFQVVMVFGTPAGDFWAIPMPALERRTNAGRRQMEALHRYGEAMTDRDFLIRAFNQWNWQHELGSQASSLGFTLAICTVTAVAPPLGKFCLLELAGNAAGFMTAYAEAAADYLAATDPHFSPQDAIVVQRYIRASNALIRTVTAGFRQGGFNMRAALEELTRQGAQVIAMGGGKEAQLATRNFTDATMGKVNLYRFRVSHQR